MRTSIDKVKVSSSFFELNQVETFGINSHNKQPNQPISESSCCLDSKGNGVVAQNIYIHSEFIPYHLNIRDDRTTIEFNPNKFKSLDEAIKEIDSDLKQTHQFEFDWNQTRLSRLDIASDCEMNNNVIHYKEPIKLLMKSRYRDNVTDYPNSLLYANSVWQKCTYDKGLKNMLDDEVREHFSTNKMRDELRLMNPKYIENNIGVSSVFDLLELSESNLKQSFVSTSLKFIKQQNESVKKQPEQLDTILDLFIHLMETTGRNGRKERILTFLNTSNPDTTFFTQRKLFHQVVQEYASSKSMSEWKSRQNKSVWIKRELETFDEMYRNQNAIRQLRTKQSDKSLNLKLDEYKAKFLVA
jgi:hypothetical protein